MKKYSIFVLLVVILLAIGYYYWKIYRPTSIEKSAQKAPENTGEITLPEMVPNVNPTENIPDTNTFNKTNPFRQGTTNPFE